MAHEDAVNEFLQADEPILVEVKRRSNTLPSSISTNPYAISNGGSNGDGSDADGDGGGAKTTVINDTLPPTKLSSGKSIVFGSSPLSEQPQKLHDQQQRHKSIPTTSIAVQTELMLCDFDSDYICHGSSGSGGGGGDGGGDSINDSPTRMTEHHHSHINHSVRINSPNNNNNNSNSSNMNHNSSNSNGHHHPLHHCAMLNECIVPPEIDIEVRPPPFGYFFLNLFSYVKFSFN